MTIRFQLLFCFLVLTNLASAQYILTLNLEQMDLYAGRKFEVRVTELGTGDEVGRKTLSSIEQSSFSVELYVFLESRSYQIDFYIDLNDNGIYDDPPVDLSWRRVVNNVSQNVVINFIPDTDFTDIGFPDNFPYSTYNAIWGGKWMNQTFGTTDSILASFTLTCDSIFGVLSTQGVFGNPDTIEFNYAEMRPTEDDPDQDTIHFTPGDPWTGEILIIDEELIGNISMSGVTLSFTGTVGAQQILSLYEVSTGGNVFANGYFYIKELEIINSAPRFGINHEEISHVTCHGSADGSISVTPEGGVPGYSYQWSTGDSTSMIENIPAGNYLLTVTDSEGCALDTAIIITQPEPISIEVESNDPNCFSPCDGYISVIITGGTLPYQYVWNTGFSGSDIFNACEGVYIITVIDANGCTEVLEIELVAPEPLGADIYTTPVSCFGNCDGMIEVDAFGGTPPYMLPPPFELCAGLYTVLVFDAAGCIFQDSAFISSPDQLIIENLDIEPATDGQPNGSVSVNVGGGIPPYEYSINGSTFQPSNVFTGLPAGNYCVFVRDINGCEFKSDTFLITNLTNIGEPDATSRIFPNPASNYVHIESVQPVQVAIVDVNGILVKETTNEAKQHSIPVYDLPSGIYIARISDGKGISIRKVLVQ